MIWFCASDDDINIYLYCRFAVSTVTDAENSSADAELNVPDLNSPAMKVDKILFDEEKLFWILKKFRVFLSIYGLIPSHHVKSFFFLLS